MATALATLTGVACQTEDRATKEKLDKVLSQLEEIEKKIDRVAQRGPAAAAAAPGGPQPGRPDPGAVYSVAIGNAPVKGPAKAKVTIVEAAEFA